MNKVFLTTLLLIFLISFVSAESTQLFVGGDDANVGTTSSRFYFPTGGGEFQGAGQFATQRVCYVPTTGFFHDLKIKQAAGPGTQVDFTRSRSWTIRVAGVDTLLRCSVIENETECDETYFKAFVNVGDAVSLRTRGFFGAAANDVGGRIDWSVKFTSSDLNNASFYCSNSVGGIIGNPTDFVNFAGIHNTGGSADIDDAQFLITDDEFHTAKNMFVHIGTAPATDTNRTFTFMDNGGATTMSCTILAGEQSCINDTNRISIGLGDELSIRATQMGNPITTTVQASVVFESTTPNLFMLSSPSDEAAPNNSTRFGYVSTGDNEWEAVEATTQLMGSNLGGFQVNITRMRARFEVSPGFGNSWTLDARKNGVTQFSCTTSGFSTLCPAIGDFSVGETDLLSVRLTPSSNPTASQLIFTLQGQLIPPKRTVLYAGKIYGAKIY